MCFICQRISTFLATVATAGDLELVTQESFRSVSLSIFFLGGGGIKKCVKSQLTNVMSVYIYHKDDADDEESQNILRELEHIDDECDQNGITFVKIDNAEEAKEYGIEDIPALVYFENGVPDLYEGDDPELGIIDSILI